MSLIFSYITRFIYFFLFSLNAEHEVPVGGQAVLEGVLMKGPARWGLAVRTPKGDIWTKTWANRPWTSKGLWKLPTLRGLAVMAEMLCTGAKALSLSAEVALPEDESIGKGGFILSVVIAVVAVIAFFVVLPLLMSDWVVNFLGASEGAGRVIEGIARGAIFVGYVAFIGMWKDIRRVFAYHGAEHKTINAYENGSELTPLNVSCFSRIHPRCGTSFLLVVVIVSVVVFSAIPTEGLAMRIGSRVLLLPFVIGISYEIIRWCGRKGTLGRIFMSPTLWLQYLTTREPDLEQLEVAITALKVALGSEEESYNQEPDGDVDGPVEKT
ncbi:DUF1385 domain-containing protein [Thermovirga lienii]|uniref:DUF1385 domain-containing protein n=1 Tax=Thermovirga lienii TaxID=336261 RepID=UPI000EEED141|nr:DUF1385 domain-containing protein [Thermovirga lienii]